MISLGRRRDSREELELGFVSEREMEDTKFEEGDACSYHNNSSNIVNNDDDYDHDASMDPDIALSYIDEKLQDVLGHFQNDFEGGVTAENLGAKFGGYGSFLPAYQWSPNTSQLEVDTYIAVPVNIVNNDDDYDYDASVDPDIALSYIDEKLQDVLGHYQKDFEGGVTAENLGAKFGGYGSFLPAHQWSPNTSRL